MAVSGVVRMLGALLLKVGRDLHVCPSDILMGELKEMVGEERFHGIAHQRRDHAFGLAQYGVPATRGFQGARRK